MAHNIYQTEGIILGGFNVRESNRFLYILTKDLGLVSASVQSVRALKSKLCASLQDFSYSKIDLVKGREVWRVTSAQNLRTLLPVNKKSETGILKRKIFTNIISLTKRLFIGEVAHHDLFDELVSSLIFLNDAELDVIELKRFEVIVAIKILNRLGYFKENEKYKYFLNEMLWSHELLERVEPIFSSAVRDINEALKETHL